MGSVPSITELRAVASKKSTNGFLNPMCDFLAFYPAKLFLYLPLNPVQITMIWILLKLLMLPFLLLGSYWYTLIALTIFQLASILDGVDGIVARYRKDYSYNGILLDYLGHYLCNSLLLICLALGAYWKTDNNWTLIAGLIGAFFYLLAKAITFNPAAWTSKEEQRREVERILYAKSFSVKGQEKGAMALIGDFFVLDNPLNAMFWGVLLHQPEVTLWVYAILLAIEAGRRLMVQYLRIKKDELLQKMKK